MLCGPTLESSYTGIVTGHGSESCCVGVQLVLMNEQLSSHMLRHHKQMYGIYVGACREEGLDLAAAAH